MKNQAQALHLSAHSTAPAETRGRGGYAVEPDSVNELATLREFNAKLLEQLAVFRRRNFELSSREEPVRDSRADEAVFQQKLALEQATFAKYREELNRKLAKLTDENWSKDLEAANLRTREAAAHEEIQKLKEMSAQAEISFDQRIAEIQAEMQAVADRCARDVREAMQCHVLEMQSLQETNNVLNRQVQGFQSESERRLLALKTEHDEKMLELEQRRNMEIDGFCRLEAERNANIRGLEAEREDLSAQLEQGMRLIAALEAELETCRAELLATTETVERERQEAQLQISQAVESFRSRETQMVDENGKLRAELIRVEQGYRDSFGAATELRTTLEGQSAAFLADRERLEAEAARYRETSESNLRDLRSALEQSQIECGNLRQLLDAKYTQIETDRESLQKWQLQLNFLDQHLQRSTEAVKKEKAEILRMSKQLANELQLTRSNPPLKDYLGVIELELGKLETQRDHTPAQSLARVKIEERLAQTISQRDFLKSVLADSQRQLDERTQTVLAIIKNSSISL